MKLGLSELFRFLNANENSRNITKGEELIDAGHLFKLGKIGNSENKLEIVGWCLQTSALKNTPHQIKGTLIYNIGWTVQDLLCSCKAGAGQQCKHIAAVLILCTRCDLNQLDVISSTDLKCTWAQENVILEKYKPVPLLDTPCFAKKTRSLHYNKENEGGKYKGIIQKLTEAAPTSAFALYRCYSIYTYKGENWRRKALLYFWPKTFSNKFVKHGLQWESFARGEYEKTNNSVFQTGLIIPPQQTWLGYSPDSSDWNNYKLLFLKSNSLQLLITPQK